MSSSQLLRPGTTTLRPVNAVRHDFRRPAGFGRDSLRGFAAVHEMFTRSVSTGWGSDLRAVIQLEEVAVEQATYADYLASMPSPHVLATLALDPLPGWVVADLDVELALTLVDRLLGGGGGRDVSIRRPTDVETSLVRHLLRHVAAGIRDSFGGLTQLQPALQQIDYNPQLVQIASPSDRVALLTYRVSATQGIRAEGLLTVCYPTSSADPLIDAVSRAARRDGAGADDDEPSATEALLKDVPVATRVTLQPCAASAQEIGALRVGDVLRLDHRVDRPVLVQVGDTTVFEGHLGRRGRRFAVQLAARRAAPPIDAPASPVATPHVEVPA